MRWRTFLCVAVASFFLLSASSGADESGRACRREELIGAWDMFFLGMPSDASVDRLDPMFFRHQRFVFHGDGSFQHISSTEPIAGDPIKEAVLSKGPITQTFSLDQAGWLTIVHKDNPVPQRFLCTYVTRDATPEESARIPAEMRATSPRKGDILLRYYDQQSGRHYGKFLRRVPQRVKR